MEKAQEPAEKTLAALSHLNAIEAKYLEKFGKDSLERVIYVDPTWFFSGNFEQAAKKLQGAIRRNRPLEQVDEKMWAKLIF